MKRRGVCVLLAMAFVAAGCGGDDGQEDVTNTSESGATGDDVQAPDPNGTLEVASVLPSPTWDPHKGTSNGYNMGFYPAVYDRLTTLEKVEGQVEVAPQLATDWSVSDDGLTWTFTLRDDVTFSDGAAFNADAVVANLERAKASTVGVAASEIENIIGIEAISPTEVELTLAEPEPLLPLNLAYNVSSGSMVSPDAFDNPDLETNPVGSGPYVVSELTTDSVTWEKRDDFWDQEFLDNAPQTVTFTSMPEDNARLNAFLSGQIDAMLVSSIPPNLDAILSDEDNQLLAVSQTNRKQTLWLNRDVPELADVRVRQAISLALDRQGIADSVLAGYCTPTTQEIGEGLVGHNPDIAPPEQDLDGARALLEEAGLESLELSAVVAGQQAIIDVATAVQAQLAEIGIDLELVQTAAAPLTEWQTGNYSISPIAPGGQPDPAIEYDYSLFGVNAVGPAPDELVELDEEASQLPLGSDERDEAYQEFAAAYVELLPNIPVCFQHGLQLYHSNVLGMDNQSWTTYQPQFDWRTLYVTGE